MKKYLVIGNPIKHSLSPTLHNYWMKKNNIDAIYEKKKLDDNDLKDLISQILCFFSCSVAHSYLSCSQFV